MQTDYCSSNTTETKEKYVSRSKETNLYNVGKAGKHNFYIFTHNFLIKIETDSVIGRCHQEGPGLKHCPPIQ